MKILILLLLLLTIKPAVALAYADCWTPFFSPGDYTITYDSSGVRYIAGLPVGTTCNCTVQTNQIWFLEVNGKKSGTTSAILAASMAGKQLRVYIQDLQADGYCRSQIVGIQPN